ncbi:MAG: ribosomal protein S18-alanine N-acetyltransferase [Deltaproteobacteria bacterium]|nr:ribosomal protein S18-alanine N-acetyltransferase [Deltaproteobacteria bacterium]MBN2670041.1 ribosomal protein S18-alanine N-acetyltransferase [Deltaproteobacteria bacterium]
MPHFASDIQIASATAEHLDAICNIENTCFLTPWTKDAVQSEISDIGWSRTIVALRESQVLGYCLYWLVADEIQLLKVAVHPQYQRKGVGGSMLQHIIHDGLSKKIHSITLELRASNPAARRLYEKLNFQVTGIRRGYYTDTGDDALLMDFTFPSAPEKTDS